VEEGHRPDLPGELDVVRAYGRTCDGVERLHIPVVFAVRERFVALVTQRICAMDSHDNVCYLLVGEGYIGLRLTLLSFIGNLVAIPFTLLLVESLPPTYAIAILDA
jgi:hypothetical protein